MKIKERITRVGSELIAVILLSGLAVSSILLTIVTIYKKTFSNADLGVYWRCLAYSVRGYSAEHMSSLEMTLPQIGRPTTLVMPHGRLLGNLIIPGYLPEFYARVYYFLLMLVVLYFIAREAFAWMSSKGIFTNSQYRIVALISILIIPWYWSDALITGNIGGILALMCVLSAFYVKKHQNIAAILLALSLIKPQIGLIFLFTLLLKREIKLLIKVAGIVGTAWAVYAIYVSLAEDIRGISLGLVDKIDSNGIGSIAGNVSGYMSSASSQGTSDGAWYYYYGLFNPLISKGVPVLWVLVLSALSGAVFVIIMLLLIKKVSSLREDYVVVFAASALASLFWCYKSQSDAIVLMLCNLVAVYLLSLCQFNRKQIVLVVLTLLVMNCMLCKYVFRLVIPVFDYVYGIFGDMILQILSFVYITIELVRCSSQHRLGGN